MKRLLFLTLIATQVCADTSAKDSTKAEHSTKTSRTSATLSVASSLLAGKALKSALNSSLKLGLLKTIPAALATNYGFIVFPIESAIRHPAKPEVGIIELPLMNGSLFTITGSALSWKQLPTNPLTRPMIFKTMGTVLKNSAKTGLLGAGISSYARGFENIGSLKK